MNLLERCGLMLEPQEGLVAEGVVKAARLAEKLGFGYIFRSDHLLPTSGRRGIPSAECWTTLGAIAISTDRVRFGPLVSPIGFRNPALLARMASTVNSLSKGRLQLGIGVGWYEDEYKAYGFPFPNFPKRREQFLEGVRIIHSLVRDGRVDFAGKWFSAHVETQLDIRGMHTIIGGKAPSIVRAASVYADEWNLFAPEKEEFLKLKQNLRSQIEVSQMGPFFIAETAEQLQEKIKRRMRSMGSTLTYDEYYKRLKSRNAIVGIPSEVVNQLNERIEWGINKFYMQTLEPQDEGSVTLLAETLKSA